MHQSFISKSSKSRREKTVLDRRGEKVGNWRLLRGTRRGLRAASISAPDESRILSPSARHFSPGIAARFYSSLLCLLVPPAHPPRSIPHLTEYTRTQVHTHYYCAGVCAFTCQWKISPRKKTNGPTFFPSSPSNSFFNYFKGGLKFRKY